jgi:hypothetical protein
MSGQQIRDDDKTLVDAFRAHRERERGRVPSFERVLGRRPSRPPARRWAPALLVAAILVLAIGVWRERGGEAAETVAFRIEAGQLRTPTDFLLDLAGTELAGGVPRFGRIDDWFGLPAPDERDAGTMDESERL